MIYKSECLNNAKNEETEEIKICLRLLYDDLLKIAVWWFACWVAGCTHMGIIIKPDACLKES